MQIPGVSAGAWKTIKGLVADTVGPMALLGVAAQKFVSASAGAALNAQRMAEALKASDGAERLKQQFEKLMGSASAAKKQVEMLAKVASGSAFTFDSLAEASKNLQVLTNGALNSERALKKVQDVAAATGAPVDTMATAVADLYNALKSGDGVEAASGQLKNMGAISAVTAQRLESLSASGVGLATTWQVVEADLNKANGAASALGGTIAGLQQQLANIQQGSDTKIGEMFAEGEKAGLRAAIGFKKFTAAVEEANAGPWAAFNGILNSVKESIGGFLGAVAETDTVKNTFNAIATVAVGVLQALYVSLIAAIPFFLKLAAAAGGAAFSALTRFAAAAGITSASVGRLANSLKGALFNGFTVGATLATLAATALAAQILKAAYAVDELNKQFQQSSKERLSGLTESNVESETARTPEERDSAEKSIKARIKQSKDREKVFSDQFDEGGKMLQSWNPFTRMAGESIVGTANQGVRQEREYQSLQQGSLSALYENPMGADQELLKISQERVKLEQQIRDAARDRIQASATPENAAKMAATQKVKAQKELDYAEKATENKYNDTKNLNSASVKFQESQEKRDKYVGDVEKGISESRDLIKKSTPKSMKWKVDKALEEGNFDELDKFANKGIIDKGALAQYREGLATKRSMGASRPELDYGAFNTNAVSDSGKIDAEIAKRTAMQEEEKNAIRDGDSVALNSVRSQMIGLKNPLTGKSELEGNKEFNDLNAQLSEALKNKDVPRIQEIQGRMGDLASKGMALSDQRLQTDLKTATDKEDRNAKRAGLENADIVDQRAKEAEAADKASKAAGQRKLNVQRQINALRGVDGSEGKAAEAELGPEIEQLKKKLAATEALEAAQEAYNKALNSGDNGKIKEAETNLNQRRVDAMGAGFKDGDTSKSADQELASVNQILQLRQQEAAITEAAAKRRRDDLMNEIKAANMINQLRMQRATGENPLEEQRSKTEGLKGKYEEEKDQARDRLINTKKYADLYAVDDLASKGKEIDRVERERKDLEQKNPGDREGYFKLTKERDDLVKSLKDSVPEEQQGLVDDLIKRTQTMGGARFAGNVLEMTQKNRNEAINELPSEISEKLSLGDEGGNLFFGRSDLGNQAVQARLDEFDQSGNYSSKEVEALGDLATAKYEYDKQKKVLDKMEQAPKTERDVQRDELKRQGGDLEKAKGAAEERDAAIKAMDGATSDEERKRLSDVAAKKKEEMASLGVDEGASVQSISTKISQNKQDQQNMLGEDVVNRASVQQDLKLTIARTKEDYGVTREDREQGRKERKDLEDADTKKKLKEDYEAKGFSGGKDGEAEKLAEFDTKRKRLQADADEAGNSRVDSFTAIGGGATNSVGVVKDIQKEILDINKKQEDLLADILKESREQKALVQGYQPDSPSM